MKSGRKIGREGKKYRSALGALLCASVYPHGESGVALYEVFYFTFIFHKASCVPNCVQ